MKKYEYRCNRCLVIEEKWYLNSNKPSTSVPCQRCGGLALRIPWSKSQEFIFEDSQKSLDSFN
jgi:rRNA maturation endonuclease Nob1